MLTRGLKIWIAIAALAITGLIVGVKVHDAHKADRERRHQVLQRAWRGECRSRPGAPRALDAFRDCPDGLVAARSGPPRRVDQDALAPILGARPATAGPLLDQPRRYDRERGDEQIEAFLRFQARYDARLKPGDGDKVARGAVVQYDGDGLVDAVAARWGPSPSHDGAYVDADDDLRVVVDAHTIRFTSADP